MELKTLLYTEIYWYVISSFSNDELDYYQVVKLLTVCKSLNHMWANTSNCLYGW